MKARVLALALLLAAGPVLAVQPDEVLPDAGLEARARDISRDLRCPVCQGENIDESDAPVSRDLRLYVRERLVAGDSDAEVVDAVVQRYGEFVLFSPPASGGNLILWLAGPLVALLGMLVAWRFIRQPATAPATPDRLSDEEQARLDRIMRDDGPQGGGPQRPVS